MMRPEDIDEKIWERADILRDQFQNIHDDTEFVARILMEVGQGANASRAGLTERQTEVLGFIEGFVAAHGYSPSYRNIADGCGLASKGRAHELVRQLIDRGAVASMPGRVRSLTVTKVSNVNTAHQISGVA